MLTVGSYIYETMLAPSTGEVENAKDIMHDVHELNEPVWVQTYTKEKGHWFEELNLSDPMPEGHNEYIFAFGQVPHNIVFGIWEGDHWFTYNFDEWPNNLNRYAYAIMEGDEEPNFKFLTAVWVASAHQFLKKVEEDFNDFETQLEGMNRPINPGKEDVWQEVACHFLDLTIRNEAVSLIESGDIKEAEWIKDHYEQQVAAILEYKKNAA